MKNYTLRFRAVDKFNFDDIKLNRKTIETRAGSERYRKVESGDQLTIICGKERIIKSVGKVHYFRTLDSLLNKLPLKKIMPDIKTKVEAKKKWYSYPGYKERIREFGIVGWELK